MPPPVSRGLLRVFVPPDLLARPAALQNVVQTIAVEIMDKRQKVVGVAFGFERLGRIDGRASFELRTGVPEGAGNDIPLAIAIEVADMGALAKEPGG